MFHYFCNTFSYHSSLFTFFIHKYFYKIFFFIFVYTRTSSIFLVKGLPNLPNNTWGCHPVISFFQVFCKQTRWIVCKQQNNKIYLTASFEESLLVSHINRSKHFEGSLLGRIIVWNTNSLECIEVLKDDFYVLINYYYINKM